MIPSTMPSFVPTVAVLLFAGLASGGGARSALDESAVAETPRVTDCARQAPEAVPLARIVPLPGGKGADPFRLASDKDHVYFASEGRIWRVAKAFGAPQPLTPPGSAGSRVVISGDSVFWSKDGEVFRAPIGGGDPESIGTTPGEWTISGQDIVTAGPEAQPAPVIRTPFGGGPSQEILPEDPEQHVHMLAPAGDDVLVQRSHDLVLIPTSGAPLQLAKVGAKTFGPPAEDSGFVYFGARDPVKGGLEPVLLRVATGGGGAPEVLLDGFVADLAVADDTLYANVVLRQPGGVFVGALVRLPKSGGAFTAMAKTDAYALGDSLGGIPPFGESAGGLEADADHVYLVQKCTDNPQADYRLVSLPVDQVISL
jgi:hypothetical protein